MNSEPQRAIRAWATLPPHIQRWVLSEVDTWDSPERAVVLGLLEEAARVGADL